MIVGSQSLLRAIEASDLPFLAELANHPLVYSTVVGWAPPVSLGSQADWLSQTANDSSTIRLLVVDAHRSSLVGMVGLWNIDWRLGSAEAGIKLHPTYFGQGYGRDAVMTMSAWAFLSAGLRRLHCEILDSNLASIALFGKSCGWVPEGRAREAVFRNGRWHDVLSFGLLWPDFNVSRGSSDYKRLVGSD